MSEESAHTGKSPDHLVPVDQEENNLETKNRLPASEWKTKVSDHFVRNHYPTPELRRSNWGITLSGRGVSEQKLSGHDIIQNFPATTVRHTMVCSGNGRVRFEPDADGLQWGMGAVGTTEWTGVPVTDLLVSCGWDPKEADGGRWVLVAGGEEPSEEDIFARAIPMEKIKKDCILAYRMGGEPLPPDHGFPFRLIVPGWYGNNCVKWVREVVVMDEMVHSNSQELRHPERYLRWQQYAYRLYTGSKSELVEQTDLPVFDTRDQMNHPDIENPYMYDQMVSSMIGIPSDGETLEPSEGENVEIRGIAWAGDDRVSRVEVSTDGGMTWNQAQFTEPDPRVNACRPFVYSWNAKSGTHKIYSRATDERGRSQPVRISSPEESSLNIEGKLYPWNKRGYGNNAYETYGVTVEVK